MKVAKRIYFVDGNSLFTATDGLKNRDDVFDPKSFFNRVDPQISQELDLGVNLDGCTLEVTWAKPPETQKLRSPSEKRDSANCLYRQINYENFEHSFDFVHSPNSPVPGFSIFPRTSTRPRLPVHGIPNPRGSFTITRPIQLLNYICLENGWGEPAFHVSRIESDPCEIFYVCLVIIPGFPPQSRRFISDKICRNPEEAKYYAACHILKKLSITDIESPMISPTHPLPISPNSYTNLMKKYMPTNGYSSSSKSVANMEFCSPPKSVPIQPYKSEIPAQRSYFYERGQGDASNFLPNSQSLEGFNFDDVENCTPLLDPNTPIEPSSILGLLASVAAATNVDLPIFNKPKL